MKGLFHFFKAAPARPADGPFDESAFRRLRWQTFLAMSVSYAMFYVCRLSFNVAKPALAESNLLSTTELGVIGSALFASYAIGKLVNGFLADHANVARYMGLGLLITALINLGMGMTTSALVLTLMWAVNGWAQSMGVGPAVVSLARWYGDKERGTFYGLWSVAHNAGEALTYIVVAAAITAWGWQSGYWTASAMGLFGVALIVLFMHDSPQSRGYPSIAVIKGEPQEPEEGSVLRQQLSILKNVNLWLLALAAAGMSISRYAIFSWGIFFMENAKGYSTLKASTVISVSAICGIFGTGLSGWISDRFFAGRREALAILFGLLNAVGLGMFLFIPGGHEWLDFLAMALFGTSLGVLLCYLGGLMAVDISSKKAAGAALGVIGIASYFGAAMGELISGFILDHNKVVLDGQKFYDFEQISLFWMGAIGFSVLLTCAFTLNTYRGRPGGPSPRLAPQQA